jgi:putative addiction module component (TIGR02574 family)
MSSDTAKLLEAVLKLPVEARAALAGSLLDSLDSTVDADAEAAWEVEIARRLQELDSPQTRLISWYDARRRIAGF